MNVSNLTFNYDDSELTFVSSDGMLQNFDMIEFQKKDETQIKRQFVYTSACFLSQNGRDQENENKVLITGQEKEVGGSLKIFNSA